MFQFSTFEKQVSNKRAKPESTKEEDDNLFKMYNMIKHYYDGVF